MMSEIASQNIHQHLIETLDNSQARYRIVEHEASGKCEAVSEIRGTALGQGAKALVCKIKGNGVKMHVLAILAADLQADLARLASFLAAVKLRWQARRSRNLNGLRIWCDPAIQFPSRTQTGCRPAAFYAL
jgi:prolyl-tRNA editing enzyme YbaK/EbsC (Cys-tRNA(Pro) deacylase)